VHDDGSDEKKESEMSNKREREELMIQSIHERKTLVLEKRVNSSNPEKKIFIGFV
jgi:hypothetical protein